jgi:DNA-binding transcriptional ArsR family regulator
MNIRLMQRAAGDAANLMRSLANETRLMIVCQLVHGEKGVGAISEALGVRQTTVSQQLSLLRREGIVTPRREAQMVYYSLTNDHVRTLVEVLYAQFCATTKQPRARRRRSAAEAPSRTTGHRDRRTS